MRETALALAKGPDVRSHFRLHPRGLTPAAESARVILLTAAFIVSTVAPVVHSQSVNEVDGATAGGDAAMAYRFGPYAAELTGVSDVAAAAVAPDGTIFASDSGRDRVLAFDRSGRRLSAFGEFGRAAGQLDRPGGIATDRTGLIYVADSGNCRIQVFDANGRVQVLWGKRGRDEGEFLAPRGLTVAGDRVYVADTGNDRVQVFTRKGKFLFAFGSYGTEDGQFNQPADVTVGDDGSIYVADTLNNRIQQFTAEGVSADAWGDWGPYAGLLAAPEGIVWDSGVLCIADTLNHRVQVFRANGKVEYQWGLHALRPREAEGKLHYPTDVAIGPHGAFAVVCESFENRCQVFDRQPEGANIDTYDAAVIEVSALSHYGRYCHGSGDILVINEPDTHSVLVFNTSMGTPILITRFGGPGRRFGQFTAPRGVFYDGDRARLYVCDSGNRRLQMFELDRESMSQVRFDPLLARFVKSLDFTAMARSEYSAQLTWTPAPRAVAVSQDGRLYVLDSRNDAVLVLDKTWRLVKVIGGHGSDTAQLRNPTDLTLGPHGESLYVVDSGNRRIQAFATDGKHLFSWGGRGAGSGAFVRPFGIAVDRDGQLLVTDTGAAKIAVFDGRGRFRRDWGTPGIGAGQMFRPAGITVDDAGRIILIDYGNHRGQIFSPEGTFVEAFGARLYVMPTKVR